MRLSEDNISIAKRRLFISEPWDSNIVKPDQSSEPMLLSKMAYEVREKPREYGVSEVCCLKEEVTASFINGAEMSSKRRVKER